MRLQGEEAHFIVGQALAQFVSMSTNPGEGAWVFLAFGTCAAQLLCPVCALAHVELVASYVRQRVPRRVWCDMVSLLPTGVKNQGIRGVGVLCAGMGAWGYIDHKVSCMPTGTKAVFQGLLSAVHGSGPNNCF